MIRQYLRKVRYASSVLGRILAGSQEYECPLCGYIGSFEAAAHPPRYAAKCPNCRSLERHRLLGLADAERNLFDGKAVLHFAPEPVLRKLIETKAARYVSADITHGRADKVLNIERINEPDGSWDVIVCCHVLEHVNDEAALKEMHRVLGEDGLLILMVPIIEGWESTYENLEIVDGEQREKHFGQNDHVRYYGRDLRDRIASAGFIIELEATASGEEAVRYSLMRGEKVFLSRKAAV